MNREIKFRAWDRKAKAMFPIHEMTFNKSKNELEYIHGVDIFDKDSDFSGNVAYGGHIEKMTGNPLRPKFELMQFTGLHDRNGEEVYEGDIIKEPSLETRNIPNCKYPEYFLSKVVFKDSAFKIVSTKSIHPVHFDMFCKDGVCLNYEVIGNIYENPELLEGDPHA